MTHGARARRRLPLALELVVASAIICCATAAAADECLSPTTVIDTFAGGCGTYQDCPGPPEDGLARDTAVNGVAGLEVAPNGEVYYVDGSWFGAFYNDSPRRIRKVGLDGRVHSIAGNCGFDEEPTQSSCGIEPGEIAFAPDGSILFTESINGGNPGRIDSIKRITTNGDIETVAGGGYRGYSGDGGPATFAAIAPSSIAVASDGSIYVAEDSNHRLRRIDIFGTITTIAGTGDTNGPLGDGGPATLAVVCPRFVSVGPDDSIYVTDDCNGNRVRRIASDGTITTVAGGGGACCDQTCAFHCGDGGNATDAAFVQPMDLEVAPDGTIYVVDFAYVYRVRRITPDGHFDTLAGDGTFGTSGDGGPAIQASIAFYELGLSADGRNLYLGGCEGSYCTTGRIRAMACGLCGNGVTNSGEDCDDGNTDDCDTCHNDCTSGSLSFCGDGHQCLFEVCDDGNTTDGDGCDSNCVPTGCGNNARSPGEKCDDGNTLPGDGCSPSCLIEPDHLRETLAPIVYLHPDEANFSMDPMFYTSFCTELRWYHDDCADRRPIAKRGRLNAKKLGAAAGKKAYHHKESVGGDGERCRHVRPNYYANGRLVDGTQVGVRPLDDGPGDEGFFLDTDQSCWQGDPGLHAPVLFDQIGSSLVYWFFYAYNDAPGCVVNLNHEGDWENITIDLDATGQPTQVWFFAHGGPHAVAWEDVILENGTHPVVFSAEGSHASYAEPGEYETACPSPLPFGEDHADYSDNRWVTSTNIRSVRAEPWWGFAGAWGEVGEIAESTGPKGPGPTKTGLP